MPFLERRVTFHGLAPDIEPSLMIEGHMTHRTVHNQSKISFGILEAVGIAGGYDYISGVGKYLHNSFSTCDMCLELQRNS